MVLSGSAYYKKKVSICQYGISSLSSKRVSSTEKSGKRMSVVQFI